MTQGMAGIDPLSDHFTQDALTSLIGRHGALPVRDFLLAHDAFTRITPALADRVLARAQIDPARPAAGLSEPERHRLHRAIRDVLGQRLEGHHGYQA